MKLTVLQIIVLPFLSFVEAIWDYGKVVHENKCAIFVKRQCEFSIAAKKLLNEKNVICEVIEVDNNKDAHDFAKKHHETFPALFYGGEIVNGGFKELSRRAKEGLPPFKKPEIDLAKKKGITLLSKQKGG